MAATSTSSLPHLPSALSPSPQLKSLKKVLSGRRRSSEVQNDNNNNNNNTSSRQSIDSLNLDRSPTITSTRSSPSRDGSNKSSHNAVHKLLPGHNKRQRRRQLESELRVVDQETEMRGRVPTSATVPPPGAIEKNRSTSSLLTDGSENDTPPPLVSRNSHTGYFTTSSPLISSKVVSDGQDEVEDDNDNDNDNDNNIVPNSTVSEPFPVILEPPLLESRDVSPKSPQLNFNSTPVLPLPGLVDKADTLRVEEDIRRRSSISKLRGKSPARKLKDVFSRSGKSPRTSPERGSSNLSATSLAVSDSGLPDQGSIAERRLTDKPEKPIPPPLKNTSIATQNPPLSANQPLGLRTDLSPPRTPPSGRLSTPLTTVTPPTPTDPFQEDPLVGSKSSVDMSQDQRDSEDLGRTSISSANSLGHRRVRSTSSTTHQKSKLSTSMTAPLTPTIEESRTPGEKTPGIRNFTAGSGFFSSWVSAAQTAATSITNLTGQNRSRASTSNLDLVKSKDTEEEETKKSDSDEGEAAKKRLAVETLGSGDLNFSHLGIDAPADESSTSVTRPDLSDLRQKSDLRRDEDEARMEDVLAKRAVSAAYEAHPDATPVAEISDPIASVRHSQTFDVNPSGALTPPNGSIFDADGSAVKRSNSVRSKIATRRSRGSSVATGQSAIGAMVGASTLALVNPANGTRTTGFTPAPKQRNRSFHQQFRSVPEDDNLIEDYSCALQKEILLAGRIYISEGHVCFSSNILGWVTTLIISFEEIVSIERENTAMIIPNAIAIQTLHARHTFRSLLSREATFDLIIGIWKVNSPASFSKSLNGKQLVAEQAQHDAEKALGTKEVEGEGQESEGSSDNESGSDEDDQDDDSAPSVAGSPASIAGSEFLDAKCVTRKPSGTNGASTQVSGASVGNTSGDVAAAAAAIAGVPGAVTDFPGPAVHGPTECTDSSTHYDKVIKDEIIPAPLGKIYSLLYGPQSGVFLRKYLVDECKCLDLVLEDDKKGLTNENKGRQYSYIKPLGGSIGPKQTKCITNENLDFFDLEKSVSVTCSTQTPDVPSGSAFSTKTRYCLSWAPGNATRLQMNCTIEWTAKSWLKGPIEKGANDGQQQYGDGLIKALKAVLGRSRGATVGSKGAKTKKKRKGEKKVKSEQTERDTRQTQDWGLFEPLRPTLEPFTNIFKPVMKMEIIVGVLAVMVIILWFGGRRGDGRIGRPGSGFDRVERLAAYEQLWQREESDLWDWLEDRAGVNSIMLRGSTGASQSSMNSKDKNKSRQKLLKDKNLATRLQAEKWSKKEMQEAVRVTRERLDEMQRVLDDKTM